MRRLRPALLLFSLVLATWEVGVASPAGATDAPVAGVPWGMISPAPPGTVDGIDPTGRLVAPSDDLAGVHAVVVEGAWGIDTSLAAAMSDRRRAASRSAAAEAAILDAAEQIAATHGRIRQIERSLAEATARLEQSRSDLRTLALERFTRSADLPGLVAGASMERTIAAHHGAVLSAEGTAVVSRRLRRAEDDLRTATTARDAEVEHASGLLGELRRQGLVRAEALGELEAAQERVDRLRSAVRSTAVAADVSGTDIPIVALDAYWRAARIVRLLHPNCGLTWWMLAGIGRTESRHGRYGGGRPGPDGTVSVPTVGIPLDGTNNTREIRDSDGGLLDGDAVYDRAVGPMQFIPTTWARWSSDGNGDGIADPQNIYDATLAAGRYLCASGPIDTDERLSHALAHYGGTRAYAAVALGIGRGYAATVVGLPETG